MAFDLGNLIIFVTLNAYVYVVFAAISEMGFSVSQHCISSSCSATWVGKVRSKIECAKACKDRSTYAGYTIDTSLNCALLKLGCFETTVCPPTGGGATFYEFRSLKQCQNSGAYDPILDACKCVGGWVGEFCERKACHCGELKLYGYPDSHYYVDIDLLQDGTRIVPAHCFLAGRVIITYILESNGFASHNKSMQEYVDGYIVGNGNRFLGLENLKIFHRYHYKSSCMVVLLNNTRDTLAWWNYNDINSIDSNNGYALDVQPAHSMVTAGNLNLTNPQKLQDVLYLSSGTPFSTYDSDSDDDGSKCARLSGAGWWFRHCNQDMNPLGLSYRYQPSGAVEEHIRLPGIDTSDVEIVAYLQTVIWFFFTVEN